MSSKVRKEHFDSLFTAFSEYQSIMDRNSTEIRYENWNNTCLNFDKAFYTVNIIKDKDKLCPQAMKYLYNICSNMGNLANENHFKYLYYWIYKHHLKAGIDRNYIKEFYKEIIRVYKLFGLFDSCADPFRESIFDNELKLITDICDISKKLNDIKYSTFTSCNIKRKCDCADECADIYMRGHKFLPYNSLLHREIKKIINMCRVLKKKWWKLENSEIYNNIYCNNNYNVLYSSHYLDD